MHEIGRLELMRESLVAVVNEMRANVIRSSYSSIIYEGHDFSCALVAGDGTTHRARRRRQPHPQLRGAVLDR